MACFGSFSINIFSAYSIIKLRMLENEEFSINIRTLDQVGNNNSCNRYFNAKIYNRIIVMVAKMVMIIVATQNGLHAVGAEAGATFLALTTFTG